MQLKVKSAERKKAEDEREILHAGLLEIQKAARRSADITRQLLAFARKQTIAPKVLDLNATVEGMLKMLRRLIGEDIDLVWQPATDLWPVRMDPSQVDQLLANLCVNARDAIVGVGRITIQTGKVTLAEADCTTRPECVPGNFVRLEVGDDGCGMDPQTLANLFEPFFTTKDVDKGTGLGLATVYGIVKQNNGFITVESQPGRGTTFQIHLLMTDVVMPEMNGRALSVRLRQISLDIRVLFMPGYTADVIASSGVLDTSLHFIQKPFSKNVLSVTVRKAL